MDPTRIAVPYQIEYLRLLVEDAGEQALLLWSRHFDFVWDARLLDQCRQMIAGIKSSGNLSGWSQGLVLRSQALLEMALGNYDRAQTDFQRSLQIFERYGDAFNSGRVLNDLGTLVQASGDFLRAHQYYIDALTHIQEVKRGSAEEAMTLNNLGMAAVAIGEIDVGIHHLQRALELYQRLGIPQGEARVEVNLGQIYRQQGEMEQALVAFQHALSILRAFGDKTVEVEVLNSIGVVHRFRGALTEAESYYAQSLALAQEIGDLGGQAQAYGNLGTLYQLQARYQQAQEVYQEALALYEVLNDRVGQAQMWNNLGHILSIQNQNPTAEVYLRRSLSFHRSNGDRAGEGAALIGLGGVLRDQGRLGEAEQLYCEAMKIGEEQNNRRLQDTAIGALGTVRILQQRWSEADILINKALARQRERGDLYAQVESLYKLGMLANEQGHYDEVLRILDEAWEIAWDQEYGRWLYAIASLAGQSAEELGHPGAYNYYATAVLAALKFSYPERFEESMGLLEQHIYTLAELGQNEIAKTLIHYLMDYCQNHPWGHVAEPVLKQLKRILTALPGY